MKPIKLSKIYPRVFMENNMDLFIRALQNREVTFRSVHITRFGDHRRMEDYPEECMGFVTAVDPRNGRDLLIRETVTGADVSVSYDGVFLEEFKIKELEIITGNLKSEIDAREEEIKSYNDLIELIKSEGKDSITTKFLKKRKITNFVVDAMYIGADKTKIEEAVEKLLISID